MPSEPQHLRVSGVSLFLQGSQGVTMRTRCECGQDIEADDRRWGGEDTTECRECKFDSLLAGFGERAAEDEETPPLDEEADRV